MNKSPTVTGASNALRESSPHSPLPWSYFRSDGTIAAGKPAHTIGRVNYGDNWQANAALIVLAVNNHAALVAALELAQATIERLHRHAPGSAVGTLDVIKAALKQAGGVLC